MCKTFGHHVGSESSMKVIGVVSLELSLQRHFF